LGSEHRHLLQSGYAIACEWGEGALANLAPHFDVLVVVDVLSFSTSVDVATARGAVVFPYAFGDAGATRYAREVGAVLADQNPAGYGLRPSSLERIEAGTRLVLPSPNGSTLSVGVVAALTIAGCLRNRSAVAARATVLGARILVVPAGERWPDGSLRPALEDLCGAGAVIEALPGSLSRSPEAELALACFRDARPELRARIAGCASGREKLARDLARDVELAAELDASDAVPVLSDGAYSSTSESIRSR
jgi:2-phosphosulfolactate phosphatase